MIEDVLPQKVLNLIDNLAVQLNSFYLAGGTALALQLGHRVSEDLDFFIDKAFDAEELKKRILPDKVSSIRSETLHCVKDGIRLSFLFYDVPLCFPPCKWRGIQVAVWQDVAAEKLKTMSQRGAKKDFYDVYAVIMLKSDIRELCALFLNRFKGMGINLYHVLKSLVYFQDAEEDPSPALLKNSEEWSWDSVRSFFETHLREFEIALTNGIEDG
jgi:predicted nucleotidyltransferase component of viral defense system